MLNETDHQQLQLNFTNSSLQARTQTRAQLPLVNLDDMKKIEGRRRCKLKETGDYFPLLSSQIPLREQGTPDAILLPLIYRVYSAICHNFQPIS